MSILELSLESFSLENKEEKDLNDKTIVMHGPLSDILYRALNIAYSKKNDDVQLTDYAIESIAQDVVIANNILEAANSDTGNDDYDYFVYGVNKMDVDEETVKEVKSFLDDNVEKDVIVLITDDNLSTDTIENPIQKNVLDNESVITSLESVIQEHPNKRKISLLKAIGVTDAITGLMDLITPGF